MSLVFSMDLILECTDEVDGFTSCVASLRMTITTVCSFAQDKKSCGLTHAV